MLFPEIVLLWEPLNIYIPAPVLLFAVFPEIVLSQLEDKCIP